MTASSLPERFASNTIANYANSFVALVLALAVTPILTRGLGQDGYGVWAVVTTSVLHLDFLQLSSDLATVDYVAQGRALGDQSQIRRTIATSFYALCAPSGLLLLLTPGLVFLIPFMTYTPASLCTAAMVLVVCSALSRSVTSGTNQRSSTVTSSGSGSYSSRGRAMSSPITPIAEAVLAPLQPGLVGPVEALAAFRVDPLPANDGTHRWIVEPAHQLLQAARLEHGVGVGEHEQRQLRLGHAGVERRRPAAPPAARQHARRALSSRPGQSSGSGASGSCRRRVLAASQSGYTTSPKAATASSESVAAGMR
jgi:hypothetical protein